MSGGERRRRAAEGGKFIAAVARIPTPATNTAFAPIRRLSSPFAAVLASISHPPDFVAAIVTHEQRSIRKHQEPDRPPPARAIGTLPADNEILHTHRTMAGAVYFDAHDLRPGRHRPIPRAVQRDERVAAILPRELRAGVERESERRGVRLHRDRRRLDIRAVRRSILGVGFAGEIAVGPAVVAAVLDDVDVLGRQVIAESVAIVVTAPQLAGRRIERQADRVSQPAREDPAARAVSVELRYRGAQRIALVTEIAGRPDREIELAIRSKQD